VEEGIVPGGGVALLRAAKAIDGLKGLAGDEKVGAMIVRRALEAPIRQIVENAGLEGSVIVEQVKLAASPVQGYDAETMRQVDMVQAGIIDPTKVARVALQNAASIAALLLTVQVVIADLPQAGARALAMSPGDTY
jgi:chaperonin GroEL